MVANGSYHFCFWFSVAVHPSVVEGMVEEERDNIISLLIKFIQSQQPGLLLTSSYR
jgi:hypothetical protein